MVLAIDCPLVILDEPTANLDPSARAEVLELVLEARRAGKNGNFFFTCPFRNRIDV